jgi:flagellar protein FlgJ
LGQVLGQALPQGMQAYQGGIDQALRQIVAGQQMQEMQRQREAQARLAQRLTPQQQEQVAAFGAPVLQQLSMPPRPEAFTLSPGQTRFEGGQQVAGLPAEQRMAPGVVGEFQAAQQAGLIGPEVTLEQFVAMKKPPAPSATAIAGGPKDTFGEEAQKRQATRFNDISASGDAARRASADVTRLEKLVGKVETGGVAAFKQAAGNIGINTKGLDDIQALQAVINKLVPAQRPAGSGTMSDADLALYKESLPRIINQPGANREIIRSMREINQYLIKEGEIADMVMDRTITPEEGRRRLAALGNPVQDFLSRTQSQPAPQQMKQSDVDLINRYLRR